MPLEYENLTEKIIASAIEVHRKLGPGFIESIYENALVIEFRERGVQVERQIEMAVLYKSVEVGKHRLDFLVEDTIVVELKAIKELEDIHFAVLRSYLKAMGKKHGLILNFAKLTLQIKRVAFDPLKLSHGFLAS
jgi:GxxExxY protein